jgi:uncharacterized protein
MIIQAIDSDKNDIIDELRKNIISNVYLYIDILMYGLSSDFIKVWIEKKQGEIKQIILRYYNSFQIYTTKESDYSDIISLIYEYKPAMISGRADLIRKLDARVVELYEKTYGVVLSQSYTGIQYKQKPELATKDDMEEIAYLVCSDKGIGGHYKPKDLKAQFISRLEDKTGRNYIIRREGKIVAHYATYAEAPEIAVMGGLIVVPEYRGKGYARLLHCYLSDILTKEKREAILFCHEEDVLKMYLKLGAEVRSEYGKATLKSGI